MAKRAGTKQHPGGYGKSKLIGRPPISMIATPTRWWMIYGKPKFQAMRHYFVGTQDYQQGLVNSVIHQYMLEWGIIYYIDSDDRPQIGERYRVHVVKRFYKPDIEINTEASFTVVL